MTCNLCKKTVKVKDKKTGKEKKYVNYFLALPSGMLIAIQLATYVTDNVEDKDKKEFLEKVNFANNQVLNAFADEIGETYIEKSSSKSKEKKDIDDINGGMPF